MKLCFPIVQDQGLDSVVYGHFGSAPRFLLVDAVSGTVESVDNSDKVHAHGACNPAKAVSELAVDGIVVGGIGRGALMSLNRAGFRVFQAQGISVRDNLVAAQENGLIEFAPGMVCGGQHGAEQGHQHGGGCCH